MYSVFNGNGNKKYFKQMTLNFILVFLLLHKEVNITLIFKKFKYLTYLRPSFLSLH